MSKKIRIPEVETLSKESSHLYDVLNNESDLACVLIATSYLDYALASLLKRHFIEQCCKQIAGSAERRSINLCEPV